MASDIIIVMLLIFANGFFTISDMAVIAAKKVRIQVMADSGSKKAESILKLVDDPTPVIATTQIGLTVITMLEGAFVEASLSGKVANHFQELGYFAGSEQFAASAIVFFVVTFLLLLIGDIIPKRIAILYPEAVSTTLAPFINTTIKILNPIIKSFTFLSDTILKFFGLSTKRSEEVSEEDFETMIEAGAQSGILGQAEKDLFENVWRLDESKVGALMTHRADMIFIDITASTDENIQKIICNPSQNLLICNGGLDHVLGYVPAINVIKDLVKQVKGTGISVRTNWEERIKQIHKIPSSLTIVETLEAFRTYKSHIALVYNEFGHVDGIVSMGDLVAAVMGDMQSFQNIDAQIEKINEDTWVFDGQVAINDLLLELDIDELPDVDNGAYQTVAGFMMAFIGRLHGRLPKANDQFIYDDYEFTVAEIDKDIGYRIDKVSVKYIVPDSIKLED